MKKYARESWNNLSYILELSLRQKSNKTFKGTFWHKINSVYFSGTPVSPGRQGVKKIARVFCKIQYLKLVTKIAVIIYQQHKI